MNFAKKEKNCRALPLDLLAKNCTKSRFNQIWIGVESHQICALQSLSARISH